MRNIVILCAVAVGLCILAPVLLAAAVAAALPHLAGGSQPPGYAATVGCERTGLEIHSTTADTSAVQYQAGAAPCGASRGAVLSGAPGQAAVAYAEAQIGTPYQWGGERAGVGFDCSGLAQAAWRAAGVSIPRVAQAQFDTGPLVSQGDALQPGDLVFFGGGAADVTHVGIVIDAGEMVDAPHTGALVRVDRFPIIPGSRWGGEVFVGATRPGGA